ncbi:MAG: aminotransferase class V-fold PLP-dependent enzyme [Candidatus Marinimicrobia bacterium]|nr:aminotransferase class V-fold PLP-dependent enzyme [Candidatus Neomarinimicrobiota bacterium]
MIPCQRHLFDIPDDVAYINCAYLSPQLRSVTEAGSRGVERKVHPWPTVPNDFFDESERARSLFAQIIGATADDIAIIPAVSYGIATAATNLQLKAGDCILVLEEQFPSNYYGWAELAQTKGADLITVSRPEGGEWTPAILSHLNEATAVVATAVCHWTDGSLIDVKKIGQRCREMGAALVIDGSQSIGVMPFSVEEVQPDFVVTVGYKWLLGPYSLGFMYVAPKYRDGTPLEHNWIDRADSEDFAGLVNYRNDFQPGARKFDMGERSNFILMPMVVAALEQILKWGVPEMAATLSGMTKIISNRAEAVGLSVAPQHLRSGHLMGLRSAEGLPSDLLDQLAKDKVYVSVRGNSVRVSPHLYNTKEDINRLFEVLAKVP